MKINNIIFCVCLAAIAAPLVACAPGNVTASRSLAAPGDPLLRQLQLQYGELALRKHSEGNSEAALHFDAKAGRAAGGEYVRPDMPEDPDVRQDYDRLKSAIDDAAGAPAVRARAQVMFDCWLDERTEAVDDGDIKACKQELDRALAILAGAGESGGTGSS